MITTDKKEIFTPELVMLLRFASKAASAIRTINLCEATGYTDQGSSRINGCESFWLSTSLMNFGNLADAIAENNYKKIISVCDTHIHMYQILMTKKNIEIQEIVGEPDPLSPNSKKQYPFSPFSAKNTFEKWKANLQEAITIFRGMKEKAEKLLQSPDKELVQ